MKKLITVKITQEQLSLLTTQLHREIGRLEEVDETFETLVAGDWQGELENEWKSICMSAIDSASLAAFEKRSALKHLLKTIESTSKQTLAWNNESQRLEVQS